MWYWSGGVSIKPIHTAQELLRGSLIMRQRKVSPFFTPEALKSQGLATENTCSRVAPCEFFHFIPSE